MFGSLFFSAIRFEDSESRNEFRPLPLLSNPHLQTLLGHWLSGPAFAYPRRSEIVPLPDGDCLVLHDSAPENWRDGESIVVLVHGLTGSHASAVVQRTANLLLPEGLRVVRVDLRGTGASLPLSRGTYHGGCSQDLRVGLEAVHRWSPQSPIILVGFSLGGNIVLKLGGEAADHPVPGLARIIALAPPVDLERCCALLSQPKNRLYELFFLRDLIKQARQRHRYFPDLPPVQFPRHMRMRLFDDLYTAPRCGFTDALDYYRRASSLPLVPRIQLPTCILSARDDPFIAVEPIESLQAPSHITVRIVPYGGHLGFLGWDGGGGIRWIERRVVELVKGQ